MHQQCKEHLLHGRWCICIIGRLPLELLMAEFIAVNGIIRSKGTSSWAIKTSEVWLRPLFSAQLSKRDQQTSNARVHSTWKIKYLRASVLTALVDHVFGVPYMISLLHRYVLKDVRCGQIPSASYASRQKGRQAMNCEFTQQVSDEHFRWDVRADFPEAMAQFLPKFSEFAPRVIIYYDVPQHAYKICRWCSNLYCH